VWQSESFQPVEVYIAVALWYLLLTTIWSLIQVQLERYLGRSDRADDEPWYARLFGVGTAGRTYA
jgi:polar amino acid transport system permease protein